MFAIPLILPGHCWACQGQVCFRVYFLSNSDFMSDCLCHLCWLSAFPFVYTPWHKCRFSKTVVSEISPSLQVKMDAWGVGGTCMAVYCNEISVFSRLHLEKSPGTSQPESWNPSPPPNPLLMARRDLATLVQDQQGFWSAIGGLTGCAVLETLLWQAVSTIAQESSLCDQR